MLLCVCVSPGPLKLPLALLVDSELNSIQASKMEEIFERLVLYTRRAEYTGMVLQCPKAN